MTTIDQDNIIEEGNNDDEDEATFTDSQIGCMFMTQEDNEDVEGNDHETKTCERGMPDTSNTNLKCAATTDLGKDKKKKNISEERALVEDTPSSSPMHSPLKTKNATEPNDAKNAVQEQEEDGGIEEVEEDTPSQQTLGADIFSQSTLSQDLIYFHSKSANPTSMLPSPSVNEKIKSKIVDGQNGQNKEKNECNEKDGVELNSQHTNVSELFCSQSLSQDVEVVQSSSIDVATKLFRFDSVNSISTPAHTKAHTPNSPTCNEMLNFKRLVQEEKETDGENEEGIVEFNSQPIIGSEVYGSQSVLSQESIGLNSPTSTKNLKSRSLGKNTNIKQETEVKPVQKSFLMRARNDANLDSTIPVTVSSSFLPTRHEETIETVDSQPIPVTVSSSFLLTKQDASTIKEENVEMEDSQPMLETEDKHLNHLDQLGELSKVAGSHSILSQEIIDESKNSNKVSTTNWSSSTKQETSIIIEDTNRMEDSKPRLETEEVLSLPTRQNTTMIEEDTAEMEDSQAILGTEEQHLRDLERSGELNKVIGSYSTLSQEIIDLGSTSTDVNDELKRSESGNPVFSPDTSMLKDISVGKYSEGTNAVEDIYSSKIDKKRKSHSPEHDLKKRKGFGPCGILIEATQFVEQNSSDSKSHPSQSLLCNESMESYVPNRELKKPKRPSTISPSSSRTFPSKQDEAIAKRNRRRRPPPPPSVLTTAEKAAALSRTILNDPSMSKQLLLHMAIVRENPRNPGTDPPMGTVIPHGFFWGSYPSLEQILRAHMKEYYDLSTNKRQSRAQQEFNNKLVKLVREEANERGWKFDEKDFDNDRKIRDRIRCFFKTHIQNSKKRLRTMLKNPTKRANAKALVKHMALMDEESKCVKSMESIGDLKEEKQSEQVVEESGDDVEIEADDEEEYAQDPNKIEFNETHDAAQQVLALGFVQLSQDSQVGTRV